MSLRWILPTVALALPALAQEATDDAVPPAPAAAVVAPTTEKPAEPTAEKPAVPGPAPAATATAEPAPAPKATETDAPAAEPEPAKAAELPAGPAPVPQRRVRAPQPAAPVVDARPTPVPAPLPSRPPPPVVPPGLPAAAAGTGTGSRDDLAKTFEDETPEQTRLRIARLAFEKLLSGDASYISRGASFPFYLDGRRFDEREALFRELLQQIRARRTDLLSVDAVEILTPDQMLKKHGKPPARLAALPWQAPNTWIAVGNLSGVPVVAIFQEQPKTGWKLVALTD